MPLRPLRLRVFQHVAHENLGSLEPLFAARGVSVAYTRFFAGDALPAAETFDFLVVLGGPMNVYEEERYPWLAEEKAAIRAALRGGKPVLGLCLGAQLMTVALDGAVTRNPHREIGWWPVEKLPGVQDAGEHWAASGFPDRFETFHWHGDTFSIPPGAVPLFCSEACAHQGFAWGDRAVALQFHPEITEPAIDVWIAECLAAGGADMQPGPFVQDAEAMRRSAVHIADNNAWMAKLCGVLCDRAAIPTKSAQPEPPVIFFDGVCGLCSGFVDFMMARDPRALFRFAPLQGETAAYRIPEDAVPYDAAGDPRSLVLWERGGVYRKSEAVLRAVQQLGGVWRLAGILRVIPRVLRDFAYDFIARNRYRWFGKHETCRMPTPAERERFLA